jgi:hypothetical protein
MDLYAIISALITKHLFDSGKSQETKHGQDYWN